MHGARHGAAGRRTTPTHQISPDALPRPPFPAQDATPSARPSPVDWAAISRAFAGPALAGLLFGYDIGATSGALVSLKGAASGVEWCENEGRGGVGMSVCQLTLSGLLPLRVPREAPGGRSLARASHHTPPSPTLARASHLTALQSGAVVSASLTGALAGSAAAFVVGDRLGRKGELVLAGGLYGELREQKEGVLGDSVVASWAGHRPSVCPPPIPPPTHSSPAAASAAAMSVVPTLPALLAARGVYGLGIGFAMHAAPAYIAETSPPAVRGLLVRQGGLGLVWHWVEGTRACGE